MFSVVLYCKYSTIANIVYHARCTATERQAYKLFIILYVYEYNDNKVELN